MITTAMTLEQAHTEGFRLVQTHCERFAAYATALGPTELDGRVPGSAWTAGEVVTHVESVLLRYTTDMRRAASPGAVAEQNADDVAHLGVDVERSSATIRDQVAALGSVVDHIPPDQRFPFHAGLETTMAGGWGNLLGELLAHGDDIARATGHPFAIPGADLEILWRHTTPLLAGWLRPECRDLDESWDVRLPIGDLRLVVAGGSATWGIDQRTASVHRTLDAADDLAELTLTFPYRRRATDDPLLALLATRFLDL